MPQLDALRVFAVAAVLVHHFMDLESLPWVLGNINWGVLGVRLFFVLSGFLITGILVRARLLADGSPGEAWTALRRFYARRTLRIFPLYYLVITIALILNVGPVREILPWLVSYTSNLYISAKGEWIHCFSHFWSLAVEEQYYLAWPWVVLFAPKRLLIPSAAALVAIGPIYRWFAVANDFNVQALRCFTLTAMDSLGAGSLLALAMNSEIPNNRIQLCLRRYVLPAGLGGVLLFEFLIISGRLKDVGEVGLDLAAAAVFAWLIGSAAAGFGGVTGSILQWRPLVFTGRITYGIYVYHFFLPMIYATSSQRLGLTPPAPGIFNLVLSSAIAFSVASLSWVLFERPINNLKRHFEYRATRISRRRPRLFAAITQLRSSIFSSWTDVRQKWP
jgi:peptidoglycan/LPS O-acetylase OafA/YrhL